MKRSDVFQSKYLSQSDIMRPTQALIASITLETLGQGAEQEQKAVAHFSDHNLKSMVLNNANWMTLEEAYGDESDFWTGKRVEIYVDPSIMFGKKRVGGLRLRIPGGASATAELWTPQQAIAEGAKVGLTVADIKAAVSVKGSWNSARDTPLIRALIASKSVATPDEAFGDEDLPPPPSGDGEVPF